MENIPFFISEHTLLHLSAVPCVRDHLLAACDVEHNCCLRSQAKLFVVLYFCLGRIVDNKVRYEVLKFFRCRTDEHICYKVCLPCNFHDETDRHTCVFVSAAESVNNEQSLIGECFDRKVLYRIPCFFCCRMVVVRIFLSCPPYSVLGILIHNDIFIFR